MRWTTKGHAILTPDDRHVPLSVRYGNRRKRFGWKVKLARESLAFWLAPWLRCLKEETRTRTEQHYQEASPDFYRMAKDLEMQQKAGL